MDERDVRGLLDSANRSLRHVRSLLGARDGESIEDAATRVVRELDYWRQQMELAGPELDRLTRELDEARDAIVDGLVERADLRARVDRLTRERDEARATTRRLNRRCQDYERALADKYPRCDDGKPRGSMMSRALLNAYATQLRAEVDEMRELAWRWCIEARAQLRRREAER